MASKTVLSLSFCAAFLLAGRVFAAALPNDLLVVDGALYTPTGSLALGSSDAQNQQKQAVQQLQLPLEVETRQTGIVLRLIPAGTFVMGSPANEAFRDSAEGPQCTVTFTKSFYGGKFEVTQGQWQKVMGSNPSRFTSVGQDAPVERVSWDDCQAFLKALCKKEGVPEGTYRLLTEAEWEYACRAGTSSAYYCGADYLTLDQYAWHEGNSGDSTHPVGRRLPNAFGLYDTHGNVLEWCQDWRGDYPRIPVTDPTGPSAGTSRIIRGGDFAEHAVFSRSACRDSDSPSKYYVNVGFRVARRIGGTGGSTTVLTFGDIVTTEAGHIPDGYGGLTWSSSFWALKPSTTSDSGYRRGMVTPDYVAYNNAADPVEVSGDTFTFVGAYLIGAWRNNLFIDVSGYRSGVCVYTRTVTLTAQFPTWFQFDYEDVDRVTFNSYGGSWVGQYSSDGTHFVMDNMKIRR